MRLLAPPDSSPKMWARATQVRFFWLLVALVGLILVAPALPASVGGEWESIGMGLVIFFSASYVTHGIQRLWIIALLGLILVVAIALNIYLDDSTLSKLVMFAVMLVILIQTAVNILSFVLGAGNIGPEHIYGAICAYVLIAMSFATLDFILETVVPGSFSGDHTIAVTDRPWWQFFYFSFTTLSTVGYGDIVAVTMRARSFVVIEQLVAVFYVAILIARLTGMYNTGTKRRADRNN